MEDPSRQDVEGRILSVNVSAQKGTIKQAVQEILLDERGVVGDAHAGDWHRQVSLLSEEIIRRFEGEMGRPIRPGEFAENITTQGLSLEAVGYLDRLVVGEAELVVTQIGKECHGDSCAIFREAGKCVMPKQGIFCRVVTPGRVRPGALIQHRPKPLKMEVITMSDRASRGDYQDRSGPEVEASLRAFFEDRRWHPEITRRILPDDGGQLREALQGFERAFGDVLVITGGTGIGPRDITPEVVFAFCDKTIPGIMEAIRLKHGLDKPNALLSRSVAGVKGAMLVYAIPGSPRAAREYMAEILKTLEHAILMLHGIDAH